MHSECWPDSPSRLPARTVSCAPGPHDLVLDQDPDAQVLAGLQSLMRACGEIDGPLPGQTRFRIETPENSSLELSVADRSSTPQATRRVAALCCAAPPSCPGITVSGRRLAPSRPEHIACLTPPICFGYLWLVCSSFPMRRCGWPSAAQCPRPPGSVGSAGSSARSGLHLRGCPQPEWWRPSYRHACRPVGQKGTGAKLGTVSVPGQKGPPPYPR